MYIGKKFNLQLFFFPLFHEDLFFPGLPRATRLLETSCLEKVTVCVIETMLMTLQLVQMNKAWREGNRTNQDKHCERFVIHLIPGSTCHWISRWMRFFLKKYLSVETFSSNDYLQKPAFAGVLLWNLFWKFHKFPRKTFPVSVR